MPELFYDCGAYGIFTIDTEKFQPTYRGRLSSPETFVPVPDAPLRDHTWDKIGPVIEGLGSRLHVIDVGGYIGTFTIPLLIDADRRGHRLTFDTFEPGPTHSALQRAIKLNRLEKRVTLHHAAMTDHVGETTYRWRGNGSIGGQVFAKFDTTAETIAKAETIDNVCRDMPGPLLIKLDTQGHEAAIMGAARDTISQRKAVWHIEFMHKYVQEDFNPGIPFFRYIFEDFHVFDIFQEVPETTVDAFMEDLATKTYGTKDLTLVPKAAEFTDRVLSSLRRAAADD